MTHKDFLPFPLTNWFKMISQCSQKKTKILWDFKLRQGLSYQPIAKFESKNRGTQAGNIPALQVPLTQEKVASSLIHSKKARKPCFKECKAAMAQIQPLQAAHLWRWKLKHYFKVRQIPLLPHFPDRIPVSGQEAFISQQRLGSVCSEQIKRIQKKQVMQFMVMGQQLCYPSMDCPNTGMALGCF